ncbi:TPA: hypothetical protein ACQK1M_002089 [Enterococcus hirae]
MDKVIYAPSTYYSDEIFLMKLAKDWFHQASQLESISWANITFGSTNILPDNISIEKTFRFSTQMYSYNLEFLALKSAVTAYRDFCQYMPSYLRIGRDQDEINYTINIAKENGIHLQPEYFSRFDKLNEIVAKLDTDSDFFESLQGNN